MMQSGKATKSEIVFYLCIHDLGLTFILLLLLQGFRLNCTQPI